NHDAEHPQIVTDAKISALGFALKLKDASMEPIFPPNTVIIVDPKREPRDRGYVVAILHNNFEPIFRQLLINADEKYLKPLSPDLDWYKMTKINKKDNILGVMVQAKRDWED
ncbi:MAG TPA: S24 family peptidase, partial [Gammaproteobacteria bacterium]|nr:S24 family peptidase [Gammaproteobacteria bacterium]